MSYISYMNYMSYSGCMGRINGNKGVGQPTTED
jgi:hypothetical protein